MSVERVDGQTRMVPLARKMPLARNKNDLHAHGCGDTSALLDPVGTLDVVCVALVLSFASLHVPHSHPPPNNSNNSNNSNDKDEANRALLRPESQREARTVDNGPVSSSYVGSVFSTSATEA